jgi:putative redox protein
MTADSSLQERTATARLVPIDGSLRFDVTAGSGQTLRLDASDDHAAQSPMEAVLSALAACAGADVISMLRKARQDVTDYRIEVRALRAEDHPRVYTEVEVVHIVTGHDLRESPVKRAVELSSTKYCSVSAMLGRGATLTHRYELVEA